ncbi:hypothetical protein T05_700 [Trichinella murrelli]|uniref:Uncharacterized protein n=1 Tax=Trichinella murrelli TaxID=144512 RepID=A0A0V0UHN8_9BILA|nr:hypothetical protein T05_700 [Trichinella murrelli]
MAKRRPFDKQLNADSSAISASSQKVIFTNWEQLNALTGIVVQNWQALTTTASKKCAEQMPIWLLVQYDEILFFHSSTVIFISLSLIDKRATFPMIPIYPVYHTQDIVNGENIIKSYSLLYVNGLSIIIDLQVQSVCLAFSVVSDFSCSTIEHYIEMISLLNNVEKVVKEKIRKYHNNSDAIFPEDGILKM